LTSEDLSRQVLIDHDRPISVKGYRDKGVSKNMVTFLVVIHVLISFLMVGVILLQSGKGAEIGAAFGGSSQTIFGSRGPGTFLSKVTAGAAVVFMLTALLLSMMSGGRSVVSTIKDQPVQELPPAGAPLGEIPPMGVEPQTKQSAPADQ
jgi:preprotein translocase subunit SecG